MNIREFLGPQIPPKNCIFPISDLENKNNN